MANVNAPFGFRPTMRDFTGGPGKVIPAHKLVGYGTALFINDLVTAVAAGVKNTTCVSAAITPGTTPVKGVNLNYGAASTLTDHLVVGVAGGAVFVTQGDGTGATFFVVASLGKNCNAVLTAGNTGTKVSKHGLSETSVAGTNTLDFRINKLFESPTNVAGQYGIVECRANRSMDADQLAGL